MASTHEVVVGFSWGFTVWITGRILVEVLSSTVFGLLSTKLIRDQDSERNAVVFSLTQILVNLVVDPFILLYQYSVMAGEYAVSNPKRMISFFMIAIVAFTVTEFHRYVIYGLDVTYELLYQPVITPIKFVVNFARLVFDIFVGLSNGVSHFQSIPTKVLIETAGGCLDSSTDVGNVRSTIEAFVDVLVAFVTELAAWIINPLKEFEFAPTFREIRLFVLEFTNLIRCICGNILVPEFAEAITGFAKTDSFELAFHNVFNVFLDLVRLPIKAFFTSFPENASARVPRIQADEFFDHLVLAINHTAITADFELTGIVDFVQLGTVDVFGKWESIPVFTAWGNYLILLIEPFRILANGFLYFDRILSFIDTSYVVDIRTSDNNEFAHKVFDLDRIHDAYNRFSYYTFEKSLGGLSTLTRGTFMAVHNVALVVGEYVKFFVQFFIDFTIGPNNQEYQALEADYLQNYSPGTDASCNSCLWSFTRSHVVPPYTLVTQRFFSTANNMQRHYDMEVRPRIETAIDSIADNVFGQYGVNLQNIIRFTLKSANELIITTFQTGVYLMHYQFNLFPLAILEGEAPPVIDSCCITAIAEPFRMNLILLLRSLPEFFETFLDVETAFDSGHVAQICGREVVRNYVYTGSSKAYHLASQACTASLSSGYPVKYCLYEDKSLCPDPDTEMYALKAYGDLQTNLVCSGIDTTVETLVSLVDQGFTTADYGGQIITRLIQCTLGQVPFTECDLADLIGYPKEMMDTLACNAHQVTSSLSNVIASFLSYFIKHVYDSVDYDPSGYLFDGSELEELYEPFCDTLNQQQCQDEYFQTKNCVYANGKCQYTCSLSRMMTENDQNEPSQPWMVSGEAHGVCGMATQLPVSEVVFLEERIINCTMAKPAWGVCHHPNDNPLVFQPYPIEASIASFTNSILNMAAFWPIHTANQTLSLVYDVVDFEEATDVASALTEAINNFMNAPRDVFVQSIKNFVLMIRDIVMAVVQFARSVVYVASGGMTQKFVDFQTTTTEILNTLQYIIVSVTELFVETIEIMFNFLSNMIAGFYFIVVGDADGSGQAFERAMKIMSDFISSASGTISDMLFTALREIKGMGDFIEGVCEVFETVVDAVIDATCSVLSANILPTSLTLQCLYFSGDLIGSCDYSSTLNLFAADSQLQASTTSVTTSEDAALDACTSSPVIFWMKANRDGKYYWRHLGHGPQDMYILRRSTHESGEYDQVTTFDGRTRADMCWSTHLYGDKFPCAGYDLDRYNGHKIRLVYIPEVDIYQCQDWTAGTTLSTMYPNTKDSSAVIFSVPITCSGQEGITNTGAHVFYCSRVTSGWTISFRCEWTLPEYNTGEDPDENFIINDRDLCFPTFINRFQTCASKYLKNPGSTSSFGDPLVQIKYTGMVQNLGDSGNRPNFKCDSIDFSFPTGGGVDYTAPLRDRASLIETFSPESVPYKRYFDPFSGYYTGSEGHPNFPQDESRRHLLSIEDDNEEHIDSKYGDEMEAIQRNMYHGFILTEMLNYPLVDSSFGDPRVQELVHYGLFDDYQSALLYSQRTITNSTAFKRTLYTLYFTDNEISYRSSLDGTGNSRSTFFTPDWEDVFNEEMFLSGKRVIYCRQTNQTMVVPINEVTLRCEQQGDYTVLQTMTMGNAGIYIFRVSHSYGIFQHEYYLPKSQGNFETKDVVSSYETLDGSIYVTNSLDSSILLKPDGMYEHLHAGPRTMSNSNFGEGRMQPKYDVTARMRESLSFSKTFIQKIRLEMYHHQNVTSMQRVFNPFSANDWESAGNAVYESTGLSDIVGAGEDVWDSINDIRDDIDSIKQVIGEVTDCINDIEDCINDVVQEMIDFAIDGVLGSILDFLDGIVGGYIPVAFDIRWQSSIRSVTGLDSSFCDDDLFTCDLGEFGKGEALSYEATVCNTFEGAECQSPDSFCWVETPADCLGRLDDFSVISNEYAMVQSCPCDQVRGGNTHCNLATGYCQAGETPFTSPLETCPASFEPSWDGYHTGTCYISPAWKCGGVTGVAELNRCRYTTAQTSLEGPYLCKEFCDPTPINKNNWLTSIDSTQFSGASCICEVGMNVAASSLDSPEQFTSFFQGLPLTDSVMRRRELLEANDDKGYSSVIANVSSTREKLRQLSSSKCKTDRDCMSTYSIGMSGVKYCKTSMDSLVPCMSCQQRSALMGVTGYRCDAATRQCMCGSLSAKDTMKQKFQEESRVKDTYRVVDMWGGNTRCDKLVRGYSTDRNLTVLEDQELLGCFYMRHYGESLKKLIGMPNFPVDIFYNRLRVLELLYDSLLTATALVEDAEIDEMYLAEKLRHLNVDPHLMIPMVHTVKDMFWGTFKNITSVAQDTQFSHHLKTGSETFLDSLDWLHKSSNVSLDKFIPSTSPDTLSASNHVAARRSLLQLDTDEGGIPSCPAIESTVQEIARVGETLIEYYTDQQNVYLKYGICDFARVVRAPNWEANGCGNIVATYKAVSYSTGTQHGTQSSFSRSLSDVISPYRGHNKKVIEYSSSADAIFDDEKSRSLQTNHTRRKSGESSQIVDFFSRVTDMDWQQFIADMVGFVASDPSGEDDSQSSTYRNSMRCDHTGAVMCKKRAENTTIFQTFQTVITAEILILMGIYFGTGELGSLVISFIFPWLFVVIGIPLVLVPVVYVHYEVGIACFMRLIPSLPVCLMDDIYYSLENEVFPEHINWPSVLVRDSSRSATGEAGLQLLNVDNVGDCTEDPVGMGHGVRIVFYTIEMAWLTVFPESDWRDDLNFFGSVDFFKTIFQDVDYYQGKDVLSKDYTTCFNILWPNLMFYLGIMSFYSFAYGFVVQAVIKTVQNLYLVLLHAKELARTLVVY
jgi:hypothetical protein